MITTRRQSNGKQAERCRTARERRVERRRVRAVADEPRQPRRHRGWLVREGRMAGRWKEGDGEGGRLAIL